MDDRATDAIIQGTQEAGSKKNSQSSIERIKQEMIKGDLKMRGKGVK